MTIKLIIQSTENDLLTQELLCEQSLITFGRSKSCTVTLDQPGVSRRHFIIRFIEDSYVIIDEGSTAGTMLDGAKLDPKNCYELGPKHEIAIPGFNINLANDAKAPRQERTTVMARKLMGKILNDAHDADHIPRLVHDSKNIVFNFQNDKASFVLGTLAHLDFVLDNDGQLAKEHVSFIRDISGVRIIPIMGAKTLLNNGEITDPEILNHGDTISVGSNCLVYQDYHDDTMLKIEPLLVHSTENTKAQEPSLELPAIHSKHSHLLLNLDRACWGLFSITVFGAMWVVFKMLFS